MQRAEEMELILIIVCVLVIYIPVIAVISLIRALFGIRRGKAYAKEKFRDTFLHFFFELLNPFNWFL